MKKILTITLVSILTLGAMSSCSNSSAGKKVSEQDTTTTTQRKKVSSLDNDENGTERKDKKIEKDVLFEEQLAGLKEVVAASCASMKTTYALYLTPNQTSDGGEEVGDLARKIDNIAQYIGLHMSPNRWKNFETEDDYYANEIKDYNDQLRDYNSRMIRQSLVMVDRLRTQETDTEVNDIIEGFDVMTNAADFGPCNIK